MSPAYCADFWIFSYVYIIFLMRAYPFRQRFYIHGFEPGMTFHRIIAMTCLKLLQEPHHSYRA